MRIHDPRCRHTPTPTHAHKHEHHIHIYKHICAYAYIYMWIHTYSCICIYVCVPADMHAYTHARHIHLHTHVFMYACMQNAFTINTCAAEMRPNISRRRCWCWCCWLCSCLVRFWLLCLGHDGTNGHINSLYIYVHKYIHTYIHTYTCICSLLAKGLHSQSLAFWKPLAWSYTVGPQELATGRAHFETKPQLTHMSHGQNSL